MSYTVLRVVDAGVVLFEQHEQRMARAGEDAVQRFREFARVAVPGLYVLQWSQGELRVTRRDSSRYFDGIPVEFAVSPIGEPEPKTSPPNAYTPLRKDGIATLLTSADGRELYEACSANLVAWDGERIVVAPRDRPRTISSSEAALRSEVSVREAPLLTEAVWPLAAINAVIVCSLSVPGRAAFPHEQLHLLRHAFLASARRP